MQTILETERLRLKPYEPDDAHQQHLIELLTDAEVMKFIGDGVMNRAAAESLWERVFSVVYAENRFYMWAAWTKENSQYVGSVQLKPRPTKPEEWEIGYILRREFWGKGYATEIAKKLIEFGFNEAKLPQIFGDVADENFASIHVLQKAGMNFERYEYDENGRFSIYSILAPKLSSQS
jgi:RimJ/RimL family protein N-acetyltransferase